MNEQKQNNTLSTQCPDKVAAVLKALLGAVPVAGSILAEFVGSVIPNQRIERIVRFAYELESRLSGIEQQFVQLQLTNENFTDLLEEGVWQAARAVSKERKEYIAALIANSLSTQDISYIESKHLLRVLGEINDIEVIRLGSHLFNTYDGEKEYWEKHKEILEPVTAHLGASSRMLDKATLQGSYDEHLSRLGLLEVRYKMDSRTKQPEFDSRTGILKIRSYELTSFGKLLLRQVGIDKNDAD